MQNWLRSPVDMRERFVRITQLIEWAGLPHVRAPHVRHLRGLRRVVVVRVFFKKTQATPAREIALALRRAGELE